MDEKGVKAAQNHLKATVESNRGRGDLGGRETERAGDVFNVGFRARVPTGLELENRCPQIAPQISPTHCLGHLFREAGEPAADDLSCRDGRENYSGIVAVDDEESVA